MKYGFSSLATLSIGSLLSHNSFQRLSRDTVGAMRIYGWGNADIRMRRNGRGETDGTERKGRYGRGETVEAKKAPLTGYGGKEKALLLAIKLEYG